jgi:SNF2 family DNA or RNA helicase
VVARVQRNGLVMTGATVPLRNTEAEDRLSRDLLRVLGLIPGIPATLDGEEAVRFTKRLGGWDGDLVGTEHETYAPAPPLQPTLSVDGDRFEVTFATADGRSAAPLSVMRRWQTGGSMVPLTGGGWSPLPEDFLRRHGRLVADLLEARDEDGAIPTCALPDLAKLCEAEDLPVPAELTRLEALLGDFEGLPEAPLPRDLTATLRGYQRQGVDWLAFLRTAQLGALLADDMGLGKTLQALCAIEGRTLVVAPTSVLRNWENEARRFRPELSLCIYHGPKRELDPDADLVITTYGLLRLDADLLAAERWDMAVLDEAQAIKNPESQVTRAAFQLNAGFRVTLTGTPVENRLEELWTQLHFLNPGLLGTRRGFQERYARPIAQGEAGVASDLRSRIRPFVLRRLKRDVAPELPPKIETVLHVTLTEDERAAYDAVRAATRKEIVTQLAGGSNAIQALTALMRLRQAACHSALLPGREAADSSKVRLLVDTLDEVVAEGHKALVFSQWTSLLDRVEPHLATAGLEHTRLDGSTRDRGAVVDAFQSPDGPPVMLISLKAGGTGLNLTAADHVFLLDPWWNPAVEDQAADRAHRIGQDRPVMVTRLVALDTVEERILALQSHKRDLADAALAGADRAAALTRDDLLTLLA